MDKVLLKDIKIVLGSYDAVPHPYHHKYLKDVSEWIISDINPRSPAIEKIDARDIPYQNVAALYASHVLEHIRYDEVLSTLSHWYEVLKEGGWVHINVPDAHWGLDALMKANCGVHTGSDYFDTPEKVLMILNGTMESEHDVHKSWYHKDKLYKLMEKAGFLDIRISKEYEAHDMVCLIAKGYK